MDQDFVTRNKFYSIDVETQIAFSGLSYSDLSHTEFLHIICNSESELLKVMIDCRFRKSSIFEIFWTGLILPSHLIHDLL